MHACSLHSDSFVILSGIYCLDEKFVKLLFVLFRDQVFKLVDRVVDFINKKRVVYAGLAFDVIQDFRIDTHG